MTDIIIEKLYAQTAEKVRVELELEAKVRIKKYLSASVSVLVKEGIVTKEEAKRAALKRGVTLDDLTYYGSTDYGYHAPGCGSMGTSPGTGNRC